MKHLNFYSTIYHNYQLLKQEPRTKIKNPRIIVNLLFIALMFTFQQCKKDLSLYNSDSEVNSRTIENCWNTIQNSNATTGIYQPGTYGIMNNCIRFSNHEEFIKTEEFLNNATSDEIEVWYNSIPILTSDKAYEFFLDQYNCNDNNSVNEINSLLSNYGSTIRYVWESQEDIIAYPKYYTYSRFRNMDGNFMIGNQIETEKDGIRETIYDGDWNKIAQIRNTPGYPHDTVSYEGDTLFTITPIITQSRLKCDIYCCEKNVSKTHYFQPNGQNQRRLKVSLDWADETFYRQASPKLIYATPKIKFSLSKLELDRKDDLGAWWCFKKHFKFNLKCNWYINYVSKFEFDNLDFIVKDNAKTCKVSGSLSAFTSIEYGPFDYIPKPMVCPYKIKLTTDIFENLNSLPENTFITECFMEKNPCICNTCPSGYYFDKANCYSNICAKSTFIWNNGYYYKAYPNGPNGGICPLGGTFDGANCYLGSVPSGYEGKAFTYNNCFYVVPKCPGY